jgi:hypothetical protein
MGADNSCGRAVMKSISLAIILALATALSGCFLQTLNSDQITYPNDPTYKGCKIPADCTDNPG